MEGSVGIATSASDALELDYHLEAFIEWHAPRVSKLVVHANTDSRDDTIALLRYLTRHFRSLEVIESSWGNPMKKDWSGGAKSVAVKKLQTKWCILLDIDEFLYPGPGDSDLFQCLERLDPRQLHSIFYHHFVGSWKTLGYTHSWPAAQWRIACLEIPEIKENISLDPCGSNLIGVQPHPFPSLELLHFGCVRSRQKLLKKWERQVARNKGVESRATESWLTSAEEAVVPRLSSRALVVPEFFRTPEFVRDDFEVFRLCSF